VSLWTRGITSLGWVGIDLDGTLATYGTRQWPDIGEPVPAILEIVKDYLSQGRDVRIMTARVGNLFRNHVTRAEYDDAVEQERAIQAWCMKHLGRELPVTAVKDYEMDILLDDRAVTVEKNTGRILTEGWSMAK
jgi:hypothetical protein